MKKLILILVSLFGLTVLLTPIKQTHAAVSTWQKAVNIQPRSNTDFSSPSFNLSVDKAVSTGVNYIILIIPITQSSIYSTDVQADSSTPTDQSLTSAAAYIHSKGVNVAYSLHANTRDGQWRALINPSDRTSWFRNYGNQLTHFATLAQSNRVEEVVVGTEMSSMTIPSINSTNTTNWQTMIKSVRGVYNGLITYSSQHEGYMSDGQVLEFWPQLDFIGISAYYSLGDNNDSVATIESKWDRWSGAIESLASRYNKQVLFTEIGYVSQPNSLSDPGTAYMNGGSVDLTLQANAYQALFNYWNQRAYMNGVAFWDWSSDPNAGGPNDNGYTPQGKPAEQVMKQAFTTGVSSTPSTPQKYTATTGTSSQPTINQPVTITTSVSAANPVSNVIVDVEVYNSQGQKVKQTAYDGRSLSPTPESFSFDWTPTQTGIYTIKVGVFTANWQSNLYWNNAANSFNVLAASSTTPPPSGGNTTPPSGGGTNTPPPVASAAAVDIWWPASSAAVMGVQPFKALINGRSLTNYSLYWQVDGGGLNSMNNSSDGGDHKEVLVDVSGWNWRSNNQYVINFVAKDLSGNVIASKSVITTVTH